MVIGKAQGTTQAEDPVQGHALLRRIASRVAVNGQTGRWPDPAGMAMAPDQVRVDVAADGMTATVAGLSQGTLDRHTLMVALAGAGVVWGIDPDGLHAVLDGAPQPVVVARGQPAIPGRPPQLVVSRPLSAGPAGVSCTVCANAVPVRAGDEVARITPTEPSVPGWTVTGRPVLAEAAAGGLGVGDGLVSDGDGVVRAVCDGHLFLEAGRAEVVPLRVLAGEDLGRGETRFFGRILIRGDVPSGCAIWASHGVHVQGDVEDAALTSGREIVVHGGVVGHSSAFLQADGDVVATFIEAAKIVAGGNVHVHDAIRRSEVMASDSVVVDGGPRAQIVGGRILAGRRVVAGIVGARSAVQTVIEIGLDPATLSQLAQLRDEREARRLSLDKVTLALVQTRVRPTATNQARLPTLIELRAVLIEGVEALDREILRLERTQGHDATGELRVAERLYGGTRLRIGSYHRHLDGDIAGHSFRLSPWRLGARLEIEAIPEP